MHEQSKSRPILLKDEMVRAILNEHFAGAGAPSDGPCKTQTRRLIDPQPEWDRATRSWGWRSRKHTSWLRLSDAQDLAAMASVCPYGKKGERLWVREAWRAIERDSDGYDGVLFRADNSFVVIDATVAAADAWGDAYYNGRHGDNWRPSIFMPRWACRIELEIVNVRVEPLCSISEDDARAEGVRPYESQESWKVLCTDGRAYDSFVEPTSNDGRAGSGRIHSYARNEPFVVSASDGFRKLWDSVYAKRGYSWISRPWVWVIEFRMLPLAKPLLDPA